jgi:hypothetical protein
MRQGLRWAAISAALAVGLSISLALLASSVAAAPTAIDLGVHLGAGSTKERAFVTPTGEHVTTRVSGLTFYLSVVVGFESSREPASATVQLGLPEGLRWVNRPDASERCTSTTSTARCETGLIDDATSGQFKSWAWRVAASRSGSYTVNAAITSLSAPDERPSDNETLLTVVVSEGITVSAPKLTPAKPKAEALVAATVRVTSGGNPVRPAGVACTGSIGSMMIRGKGRVSTGFATCSYRPPASAKGKTLRGSVAVTLRGQRLTKRFSARLG